MRWFAKKCVVGAHNKQKDLRSQIPTDTSHCVAEIGKSCLYRGHLKTKPGPNEKGRRDIFRGQLCLRLYREEVSTAPNHTYSPQSSSPSLLAFEHLPHRKPDSGSSTTLPLYEAFTQQDSHSALQEAPSTDPQAFTCTSKRQRKKTQHPPNCSTSRAPQRVGHRNGVTTHPTSPPICSLTV